MSRGKHKQTAAYANKRKRWTGRNPRGEKKGGGKTKFKRNVKKASEKRYIGRGWKA